MTTSEVAMGKWSAQYTGRLKGIDFKFFSWIQNIPRGLIYFLPWLLLLPFARFSKFHDEAERRMAWALSWGTAVPFVAVSLDECGGGFRRPGACDRCDWLPGHGSDPEEQTAGEKGSC